MLRLFSINNLNNWLHGPKKKPSPTFEERLNKAKVNGYQGYVPDYCLDPISANILEKPIKLDDCEKQSIDQSTLVRLKENSSARTCLNPFTNKPIKQKKPHLIRTKQIEAYVSGIESIYEQNAKLNQFDQDLVSTETLFRNEHMDEAQLKLLMDEERIEQAPQKYEIKLVLKEKLEKFLETTRDAIIQCNDTEEEKKAGVLEFVESIKHLLEILQESDLSVANHLLYYQSQAIAPKPKTDMGFFAKLAEGVKNFNVNTQASASKKSNHSP